MGKIIDDKKIFENINSLLGIDIAKVGYIFISPQLEKFLSPKKNLNTEFVRFRISLKFECYHGIMIQKI